MHVRNFLSIDTKIVSILSSSKKTAIRGDAVFAGIADCTKIHKICGWKAKVKILEGLKKTYD